jgi:hypothetical protein
LIEEKIFFERIGDVGKGTTYKLFGSYRFKTGSNDSFEKRMWMDTQPTQSITYVIPLLYFSQNYPLSFSNIILN